MPDRRKKKTREDAVEMLKRRASNNALKNEAQSGMGITTSGTRTATRNNVSGKAATTQPYGSSATSRQSVSTSRTTNPSTSSRNSLQTSQRGSQSPSAVNSLFKETARKATGNSLTDRRQRYSQQRDTKITRPTASVNNVEDRRSGRYRNDRREQQSYVNTPRNSVQYDKGKTTIGDRVADTLKGSAKQWAGGHLSSVGTAAQFAEPTVRGIQKTEYRDPGETGYSLRSRKEADLRQNERTQNIALKEGRDLRTFKGRDYSDKNANLQAFIHSADNLIESGSRDIERAKKGTGKIGSFAIDTMSNMAQMGGDLAANVALPGLGMVALGMRSAGMGSYQARQQGLDVNEQALHGLIDGVVEMGSEAIFGGVSALQKTYGKGMFSLADKLGWRTASSEMVRRMFKTDFGRALATHLSRLGAGMLEEGTEELIADVFEPTLKYVFTKANNPDYKFEGTDLKQMGYDFLLGAMTAGVLGGGSTVAGVRADSQAFVDGQNYAQDLVNRARVQGREGVATTNAEILGGRLQSQMERGIEASPYQIRTLQEAVGESQLANAIDYEKRNAERYQQAVDEGRADTVQQQGTYQEYEGYRRRVDDTLERNYERARSVMGENASEESVNAVRNVITGSTDNYDIDTVLTDNEAKKAVETLTGTKLSVNNQTARNEIENIALTRQIQNRDAILQETHESIRTEMSKRGGQLFDENYDRAVETLDVPNGANIYDSFFSRFYTDGTVKGADFDKSYNRIMGSIREDFGDELAGKIGEVFNMDFAQKVFAEGQMAQATYNAKYQGKALSLKASENPAGFTYEDTARAKISDRQADLLTKFAERANIHIRLVDSIAGGSANGSYENGVIMIAADSTNKLVTVAKHELTHHIRSTSPELYQKLEDFIFNKYYEFDADGLENKIREYQERGYNMTAEKIKEEIVADASEAFFTDEGSIQAVVKHDRGLAQAIHDGIKTLLDTFLDLQDSDELGTRGYGDFLKDIDILREAEKMWLDALNDSVQRTREARPSTETVSESDTETKHSLKEQDQAYMDAVNRGDMETAQKMVDEAAKDAGYTSELYHGTKAQFNSFDINKSRFGNSGFGIYFGDRWKAAEYGGEDKLHVYVKTDNLASSEKHNITARMFQNAISRLGIDPKKTYKRYVDTASDYIRHQNDEKLAFAIEDWAKDPKYYGKYTTREAPSPGEILSVMQETLGYDGLDRMPRELVLWDNRLVKLADPVTYDDQGNVIPLSERFNQENEDIRYSIKEDEETTNPNVNVLDKSGKVLTTSKGDPVAKFEKNGSAQFSLKTYEDKGRSVLKNYLKKMVKAGDFSQAEADQMFNEMETIYRITRDLADTGKYAPFTAWSEADVVMGKNNKPVFSSVKANSEYKMNIDFSTICKKRRTLDAVFRTMINRGMMENLDLNKDESAALVVNINDLIRKYDFEAACALCFVEARRYRQQQTAKTFRDMWNGLVESMYKDKSKIDYFNFGEDKTIKEVPDGIHTMQNKDLDLTYVRQIATARKEDGKLMQTAEAKAAREILNHPSQRKLMRIGDMMASTGFENMQVKNPALMKIYNAKKGTGGAKSSFGDVQYLNEIINSKTFDRKKAYAVSGVRIQSFSDYVPRMVFDYVQVIADLAAKRLPAHAYTKEVLFVLQFGLTGTKINMSLVPDVVKDGIAPGLDKDGNYVWNTDGTFPWEDYKDAKGRTWPGARSIQKAKGYKENCGTIAVGISDEQIWKMLADPEIQMVIPYHKSSLNPLVAQMTNVDRFTDYTDYQNTKTRDGKNVPKEFDWDNKLFELSHGKDGKLLPKSEWGDIQDLVQEYVDWCNENDYVPKFERFLYMQDGSINPGYYKMLEDFALLDEEGNFKPQDDVKMRFPTKDSAYGDMASLIEQGLSEDTTLERKRDSKVGDIVDEIGELLKTEEGRQALTQKSLESDILSARMENEDEDIRYQLKEDSTQTIASQNTISKLEEQVKDLKAEFKRTNLKTANQKDVRVQAGRLIRRHDSNLGTQKSLMDTFNKIFNLYKEKGTDAFDEVYEIAKDEAVNIVNNISVLHNEGSEEYKAIKEYLRTTPIEISEDMKRNITDYESFRKRNFGRLKLKNGETSNIDNVYMELMELFPGQFTEDYVNPADQLNHIVDVLDNYAPIYENLDGASEEMQDYVVDIAADIMETAYNLQTKKTFADKKYEEKVRAVEKARQKALESRNKALEKQKSRYEDKISALKQKNKDFKSETREKAEKKRRIKQISNIYKRLNERLQKATDTKHLPDGYAPIVSNILARFDFTTEGMEKWAARTGKTSRKMYTMNNLQSQLRAMAEAGKEGGEMEIDADLIPIVEDLTDILGDNEVRISDLNSEDLTKIKQLFAAFEHQLNTYNRRFVEGKNETISGSANKAFDEMKDNKWKLGVMGRVYAPNMNPSDFFALVGGEIEELYNNTRKGFDKYVQNMDDAREFIQGIVNSKTADKWANHTNTYKTSSGDEVKLTDTQLMDLYVSSKREQAQGHIYYGGIVSAPVKITKKGKLKLVAEELEEKRVIPTQEDLVEWFKNLSKEQIKAADAMQKYLTEVPSEWGNETSMVMYNYRKFNEKNYWPIQSSTDYRDSNFDMKGTDPTLKNISPSKAVVKGANNAIMIDDIFSVFCTHIAQMASYNAYVPAISDFQRVWNYSEGNNADKVKARFKAAYGKQAFDYVEDFFKSLNGTYKDNIGAGGLFDKTMGLFKKAAVGGNIRVLVQQPTAIARAALIVNPAYLTASIPSSMAQNKKVYQEMMEHCPIAKWKVWGFYSTDVSSASRDLKNIMIGKEALTDKIFMDMYGKADNVTWTVIFNACKMQVEAQNKGLKKGSDEYWEKVNDLASRVFDRTQVVDSPFHRSNLMKSTDTGKKMLTAFMAEPTKTVNMLNTELTLAMRELRAGKPGKAAGTATRVLMVFMANAALLACAQALVDAMRHTGGDDDKDKGKYGDRWAAYWKDNFKENMEIIGMIPILKDVKSISDGYDVARMDMQGIQRVVQSVQYLKKYRENPSESKYTGFEEYSNVAFAVAYALGIPVSNVKRDIEAAALTGAEATNNPDVALWFMKNKYQVNSKTKSLWINSYFNALDNGNEGLANNIKKYITSNGVITDEDIQKAENKRRKDNPTEEDKARIEKSQQALEGSNIWKTASDDDKDTYSGYLENIALGIENRNTASITNYATDGLTNEQVVLFKLALRKVDKPNKNGNLGTFDKDEKEAALKLLMQNYKLTEKQKDILLTIKS